MTSGWRAGAGIPKRQTNQAFCSLTTQNLPSPFYYSPRDAPDFAACTRVVLRDMKVPDGVLHLRPEQSIGSANAQTAAARGSMGSVTVMGAYEKVQSVLGDLSGMGDPREIAMMRQGLHQISVAISRAQVTLLSAEVDARE